MKDFTKSVYKTIGGVKRMTKLYCVEQGILGKDKSELFCFEKKEEAEKYYNQNDYCDKPVEKTFSEEQAKQLIEDTKFMINHY